MTYLLIAAGILAVWLVAGRSGGGALQIARGANEFETWLRPVPGSPLREATGKAEREQNFDGSAEFELWCVGLESGEGESGPPADATVEVVVAESVVATAPIQDGKFRLKLHTRNGDEVPVVEEGTEVSVRYEGVTLLQGRFRRD